MAINIIVISLPLLLSFDKKVAFYKKWPATFFAITGIGLFFIIWDVWFTASGVWGFNPIHLLGKNLANLPVEEILFFVTVPYAFMFTYACVKAYFPKIKKATRLPFIFFIILIPVLMVLLILHWPSTYTVVNFGLAVVLLSLALWRRKSWYPYFVVTYLIILVPFLVVNGYLTGMFTEEPVVWYNHSENMDIRIISIPVEDTIYALNLLFMNTVMFEWYQKKFSR